MVPSTKRTNLVMVQRKVKARAQFNDDVAWEDFLDAWVSITPNRGREITKGNELQSIVTHTIRGDLYDLEDVKADMRIIWNIKMEYDPILPESLVFNILSAMPDFDGQADMMMQCDENPLKFGIVNTNVTR